MSPGEDLISPVRQGRSSQKLLNAPGKSPPPGAGVDNIKTKVPTPDDMVVISQPLLKAATRLTVSLKNNVAAKWALGGDAGETMSGVNVSSDHLEVLTTKEGCEQICNVLKEYVTRAPAVAEKKLPRDADVEGKITRSTSRATTQSSLSTASGWRYMAMSRSRWASGTGETRWTLRRTTPTFREASCRSSRLP